MSGEPRTEWPFVELEASETDVDSLGSALVDLGANGIEQFDVDGGRVRVVAYFATTPDLSAIASALAIAPGVDPKHARRAAASLKAGATPDDDWLRLWKRGFEPTPIGRRLLVVPSWRRAEAIDHPARVCLEVDPGMAFGTGTHETTRLCLGWIDANWTGGSLLDVGTGTGILAIAAVLLEPSSSVVGIDVDAVAVDVARENASINGVASKLELRVCGPGEVDRVFDAVIANLTADAILAIRQELIARVCAGGSLVLSGILVDQADSVADAMLAAGLLLTSRLQDGEWVSLALRRP